MRVSSTRNGANVSPQNPKNLDTLCINTIRTLSIDAVQKANSGHPGAPMGLAPVAFSLWQYFLRYDPVNPQWPNRDRFVLSAGHASMLLYSVLHLAGVKEMKNGELTGKPAVSLDDIEHFRQEMKKVYPDRYFVRLDVSDPIFSIFYKIQSLHEPEVVAPYVFDGQGPVEFWGLRDKNGNLRMVLNNNNDISEYWEWVDEGQKSLHEAATSFHFGINYVLYAMTH